MLYSIDSIVVQMYPVDACKMFSCNSGKVLPIVSKNLSFAWSLASYRRKKDSISSRDPATFAIFLERLKISYRFAYGMSKSIPP